MTTAPITVTVSAPDARAPGVWRVRHGGQMIARLTQAGDRWRIQRVGQGLDPKRYLTGQDAIEAMGWRTAGTPAEEHAWALHTTAVFHHVTEVGAVPAVQVGGALVSVYVDRVTGVLRVHVDTSDSELPVGDDGVPHAVIEVNDGAAWINAPGHCERCGGRDGGPHGPDCW